MAETKFTTGPWQVVAHELKMKAGENVVSVPEYNIKTTWIHGQLKREATVLGIGLHTNEEGKPDKNIWLSKEDATLIAASPEMYAALEKIIEMNRQAAQDQYGDIEKAETWDCVKVAREAIAKARGERSEILANMMDEHERGGVYSQQAEN